MQVQNRKTKIGLTHYSPYPLKTSENKTKGFLTFPGGIDMEHWAKMS